MIVVQVAVAALIGYLLGAIPVGLIVCRVQGVDPRQHGSGRTGGTNVYRATNSVLSALLTVAGDVLKGTLAVIVAGALFPNNPIAMAAAGIGAVAGHNWSAYIRCAGGAGTMTNFGALLGLSPLTAVVMLVVGAVAFWFTRMASVGSLAVAWGALIMLIVLALAVPHAGPILARTSSAGLIAYAVGQVALVTWALRPNIRRIFQGEERRVEY